MANDYLSEYARKLALLRKEISEIHTALRQKKKTLMKINKKCMILLLQKETSSSLKLTASNILSKKVTKIKDLCISY